MDILLVDDNLERMRKITNNLLDYCNLEYVTSKKEALKLLSKRFFDLVIVDLILPEDTSKECPSADAGRSLIETIFTVQRVLTPFQVVGITVEKETYENNLEFFSQRFIPLIFCDNDNKWCKQLLSIYPRVKRISDLFTKKVDFAIITAVEEEYEEVLNLPVEWKDLNPANSLTNYKVGHIGDSENKISLVAVKLNDMGLVSASRQTAELLNEFQPKIVCMCGICAGIKGKVNKGDLIVAEKSWDYGNGKVIPKGEGGYYYGFSAEPNQISLSTALLKILREKCGDYLNLAVNDWNSHHQVHHNTKLRIGALPSGAAVVQDENLINSIVLPQHRKCLGIDMETYAVYYACHNSKNNPYYLSMKAVVDFADSAKDDQYHEYCSYISARTLYFFIKEANALGII